MSADGMITNSNLEEKTCCICGKKFIGWGNNPYPLCDKDDYESRCCDECNDNHVIPARLAILASRGKSV